MPTSVGNNVNWGIGGFTVKRRYLLSGAKKMEKHIPVNDGKGFIDTPEK